MTDQAESPTPGGKGGELNHAAEMETASVSSPTAATKLPPNQLGPGDERTWGMLAHLSVLVNLATGFGEPIAGPGHLSGLSQPLEIYLVPCAAISHLPIGWLVRWRNADRNHVGNFGSLIGFADRYCLDSLRVGLYPDL